MVVFFGAVVPRYDVDFRKAVESALLFEELGFSSLWVTDHLQPRRASRILESWTLLSALAPLTDARLGTVVLCSCYRHPSLLAKMAATLDVISNGRLELGIGTGSEPQAEELISLGMETWPEREKIGRFSEYVEVLRLLLKSSGSVDFRGRFYQLSKAICNTPTVQKPTPPIWVGARKKRMVKAAATLGDGWNFYGETLDEYRQAIDYFENTCAALGRRPGKSVFTNIVVYSDDSDKVEKLRKLGDYESEEIAFRKTFTMLYGTVDKVVKMVEELQSLGVGLIIVRDVDPEGSSIKLFAREVMPSFT
ncbi:MAG: LLM class flavin-dependent oxidoreductase [Candidatus Caldarchaeum sp.]|nr:LLM class flavin-dependent oxidoreductase [Candidatus Caldarchaeum sp.]